MIKKITNLRFPILFRIFHVVLLVCILIEVYGSAFGIQNAGIWHWIAVLSGVCVFVFLNYGRARSRLICCIMIVVCFWIALLFTGAEQMKESLGSYFDWLMGREGWNTEWIREYELVQTVLVTACCYLFQMLSERYGILRIGAVAFLLAGMIVSMVLGREISHVGVVLSLGYILIGYIEGMQRFWKKKKERDTREYVLWLLPFCALYMVVMLLMPVPDKPYDWQFVKDAYNGLKEDFTVWNEMRNRKGQEDFGTAVVGFSEDGRLMSGLFDNNQELLTIQGSHGLVTNVYLVGKVYDTFNGKQWLQTSSEDTQERMLDTLETLYAIEQYDEKQKDNYIHSTGLSICYKYFDTGCVFAPLKLRYIKGCDYLENGGNLLFGEQKGYGTQYQAVYYQINLNHPKFYEMTEMKIEENEELWNKTVKEYSPKEAEHFTLEELKLYQAAMKKKYHTKLTLSEETQEYLSDITKDAETTIQKLIAIEKELSSYTYTKNPGKLPDAIKSQEEFLDYFLLESRQGYCSYFATAFVLMARAEGIPARYVQGFCVPVTTNKKMTVTANMAHAWPEVYIEGIGWLPFEPTPGYEEIRYTPWEVREEKNTASVSMEEETETISTEMDAAIAEANAEKNSRLTMMILSGFFAVLVTCILVLCVEQWLFGRRYERMTVEERFLVEVRKNLWLLSKLGYVRQNTETLEELQKRVICSLPQLFQSRKEIIFLRGYEEYLYRRSEVQKDILNKAISEREEILQWIKSEKRLYFYIMMLRLRFVR